MNKELLQMPHEFVKDENGNPTLHLRIKYPNGMSVVIPPDQLSSMRPVKIKGERKKTYEEV